MASGSAPWELLVRNGFIKSKYADLYKYDEERGHFVYDAEEGGMSESHADQEVTEEVNISNTPSLFPTGFPAPYKRYRLIYEAPNASLEETYFWFLGHLRQDQAFPHVHKISDIFSASENSAFFGQSAQRLSIQEDRASSFLRGISELVKQLFQIVRELRIIDERLEIYDSWEYTDKDGNRRRSKSADASLKGIFSDFAENKGGQMQPGSIYHLAQQVGYASLPDLFFNTHIYRQEKVDEVIDGMTQFNKNVRNVLKRKLFQFLVWKEKTHDELRNRKRFQVRYLRQHWATIKMYMAWTKPYLKHIKRLHMNESQLDSPDLVSAFETSMTEVELLFRKPGGSCVLATFQFKTKPLLQYRQEYQQGPVHVGRVIVTLRAYGWKDDQVERYKKMREDEERDLLYLVDDSVQAAMDELGDDLEKYLNQAGEDVFDRDVNRKYGGQKDAKPVKPSKRLKTGPSESFLEPLVSLFKGVGELGSALIPVNLSKNPKGSGVKKHAFGLDKVAAKGAAGAMWQAYKNYKKSHGMLSW